MCILLPPLETFFDKNWKKKNNLEVCGEASEFKSGSDECSWLDNGCLWLRQACSSLSKELAGWPALKSCCEWS